MTCNVISDPKFKCFTFSESSRAGAWGGVVWRGAGISLWVTDRMMAKCHDRVRVIQGDSKNMSPLAFNSNNSRPMSRTTLPDTAFERADNFLSNEYIHTRFPFQIASSQAENQKWSGFCVFRFQTDFDEREHFVLSPLYRNIAFIWSVKCAQSIPVPPEPPSSSRLTKAWAQSGHRVWQCIPLDASWRPVCL